MRDSSLQWFCCPSCAGPFVLKDAVREGNDLTAGQLVCRGCAAVFPIVRSIPRFVASDVYTENFSFQWNRFARTQVDESGRTNSAVTFVEKTGFRSDELKGKLVLDVGVGSGRYADVVERAGGVVVGIDLSFSVEAAFRNFGARENFHLAQADVFSLPFKQETFDVIYSIGVLHHTPDCRQAFLKLPPLLKKDGKIGLWVYEVARSKTEDRANRFWRRLARALPQPLLYGLCVMAAAVSYVKYVPLVNPVMRYLLPRLAYDILPLVSGRRRFQERVLNTFDWYSPLYQSRHTYPDVFSWFEEAGLGKIRIFPTAVAVQGTRTHSSKP